MRVSILSPYPETIAQTILKAGDEVVEYNPDFIVSYGHKKLIYPLVPAINLHISYLPWNRGYHPNFWSWFDGTPTGVSIHRIDAGIDTGPILVQRQIFFTSNRETLASSYQTLRMEIEQLFADHWSQIRRGSLSDSPQGQFGTLHYKKDLEPYWPLLPKGWDTPVEIVEEMGAEAEITRHALNKWNAECR